MAGAPTQGQAEGLGVIVVPYYPTQAQSMMLEVMLGSAPPVVPIEATSVGMNVIVKAQRDIQAAAMTLEVVGKATPSIQAQQMTLEVVGRPPIDIRAASTTLEVVAASPVSPPSVFQESVWWVVS